MQTIELPEPALPLVNNLTPGDVEKYPTDQPSPEEQNIPKARYVLLILAVSLGFFLSLLDASIVATAMFKIALDLGETDRINWVALSYTLTYLGFAAFMARISDVVGRKAAFSFSYIIFVGFSLGCGWSKTMNELIICRAFQGLGGSGLYSIAMVMLPELMPSSQKQWAFSIVGLVIATSGVMGPVLGGLLTQYTTWRWVFWINGPLGIPSLALFHFSCPKDSRSSSPRLSWKDLDYVGSFLLIMTAVLLVFPFQHLSYLLSVPEPNLQDYSPQHSKYVDSPYFQASFTFPLASAFVVMGLFFTWQHFASQYEGTQHLAFAFPRSLMRNRVYIAAILNTLMMGFPYLMCVYAFPIRFQIVYGKSPLQSGLMLLPMLGSSAIATVLVGAFNTRKGKKNRFCETMTAACGIMLLGCGLQITTTNSDYLNQLAGSVGLLALIGFGFGMSASMGTLLSMTESEVKDHATAQGLLAQIRILGGSIGIAASSALLAAKAKEVLGPGALNPEAFAHMSSTPTSHTDVTITPEQWTSIRNVYTLAIRNDMVVCCAVLGVGALCSSMIYRRDRKPVEEMMRLRVENEVARQQALAHSAQVTVSMVQMNVVTTPGQQTVGER
ncbi:putative transporter C3H1.06c [Podospora fimiseda]|uniref:Transporter C3H1.06c n=1 Tax=Podospora fimiseda TaxID=252190 RepID=A0AAN7BUV6_9PEZI|nr:putative transporter C3H1.06c [Podospora fimiseda]